MRHRLSHFPRESHSHPDAYAETGGDRFEGIRTTVLEDVGLGVAGEGDSFKIDTLHWMDSLREPPLERRRFLVLYWLTANTLKSEMPPKTRRWWQARFAEFGAWAADTAVDRDWLVAIMGIFAALEVKHDGI